MTFFDMWFSMSREKHVFTSFVKVDTFIYFCVMALAFLLLVGRSCSGVCSASADHDLPNLTKAWKHLSHATPRVVD